MTPKEFVKLFYTEKNNYLKDCFDKNSDLAVAQKIKSLKLGNKQAVIMRDVLDGALTDIIYTILLGIDGEASIGKVQICYKLFDEEGNELTESGEIESEAWELFQNKNTEG